MSKILVIIYLTLTFLLITILSAENKLIIYTENDPPSNFVDYGQLKGSSVEIVRGGS